REGAADAEGQDPLHRVHGLAPAVRIARIVRLAHAADQGVQPAPVGERGGIGQEDEIAPRYEGRGQPALGGLDRPLGGQRGLADGAERADIQMVVRADTLAPYGKFGPQPRPDIKARRELRGVSLAVVEAHGLDPLEPVQRPGQADAGVLSAREEHERGSGFARWIRHQAERLSTARGWMWRRVSNLPSRRPPERPSSRRAGTPAGCSADGPTRLRRVARFVEHVCSDDGAERSPKVIVFISFPPTAVLTTLQAKVGHGELPTTPQC